MGVVLQMVQQNHDQAEAGHGRLRGDLRDAEIRLTNAEALVQTLTTSMTELRTRVNQPPDISAGMLPLKFVAPIVITGLIAAGAIWRQGSLVDELRSQMTARAKLEDERDEIYKAALKELKQEVKLYEIKTDELKDSLLKKGVIR